MTNPVADLDRNEQAPPPPGSPRASGRSGLQANVTESWRDGFTDPYSCEFPLEASAGHYVTPARIKIEDVAITLMLVHARDDPLVSHDDCYDWHRVSKNKNIIVVRTDRGGHAAWHEGVWPTGHAFMHGLVMRFLSASIELHAQASFLVDLVHQLQGTGDQVDHIEPAEMARAISQASIAGATQPEARPDEPLKSLAGEVRRRKSLAGEISAGVIRNMMGGWGGDGPESPQRTSESDIVMF
jgi:hypothetical protein